MGVRKDGITLVDDVGGGTGAAVDIVSPIGPAIKANSLPVTLATDEDPIDVNITALPSISAIDTLTFNGDVVDVLIPNGYNTVLAMITGDAAYIAGGVGFQILEGATVIGSYSGMNLTSNKKSANITAIASTSYLFSFPVQPNMTLRFTTAAYVAGTATITTIISTSPSVQYPMTDEEFRASNTNVTVTAMSGSFTPADNTGAFNVFGIGSFGMMFDGINWDRVRGDSVNGLQVDLGINNDVRVTDGTDTLLITAAGEINIDELPATAALADNTANPTITKIQTFPMLYDGVTWDRMIGNSVDGLAVNLAGNNDVRVFDGAGNSISSTLWAGGLRGLTVQTPVFAGNPLIGNETLFLMGAYDGANFQMLRVTTTAPVGTEIALITRNIPSGTQTVDTELPTAALLTDNFANPTTTNIGAMGMLWDGATWDRFPGTSVDGALVNLGINNDITVTSGNITADTELPSAILLADNLANPTAPAVGSYSLVFDGVTWDRMKGDSTDGLLVNLGSNNDVTVTTMPSVTATVVESDSDEDYTLGAINSLTQSIEGFLRTLSAGLVSSGAELYSPGDSKPLSLTSQGRLRVAITESLDNLFPFGQSAWPDADIVSESVWGN